MSENKAHQGYVLLESVVAFVVVTLLVLELLPLLIFLRQQESQQTARTESLRYLYELSTSYRVTGEIEFGTVIRRGHRLTSSGSYDHEKVSVICVETEGARYEIIWQE